MNDKPDDMLREARDRLTARAAELRDRLDRVRRDLRREREPLPGDFDDAAIVVENDEVLQAIEQASVHELGQIDVALARIADGTFTRCDKCGGVIDAARLAAVPYAVTCRACARDT